MHRSTSIGALQNRLQSLEVALPKDHKNLPERIPLDSSQNMQPVLPAKKMD